MDTQPAHENPTVIGISTWIMLFILGIISSSFSVVRNKCSVKVAAFHILLGSFVGPLFASIYFGIVKEPSLYMAAGIVGMTGLMIFGVAVNLGRTEKRIEDVNPLAMTGVVSPEKPPVLDKKAGGA